MRKIVSGVPDQNGNFRVAGGAWYDSCADGWNDVLSGSDRSIILDLSNIDLMPMYTWVSTLSMLEAALSKILVTDVSVDFVGGSESLLMSPDEFIREYQNFGSSDLRIKENERIYNLGGFVEALGTHDSLNRNRKTGGRFMYPHIGKEKAGLRSQFYAGREDEETVLMPITGIESESDCEQFLDQTRIASWRAAMDSKFRDSPLFKYDELWRVFCYELSANIHQHGGSNGFLACRVVRPINNKNNTVHEWCKASYSSEVVSLFPKLKEGFLELCISDAGDGIVDTLSEAYSKFSKDEKTNQDEEDNQINPVDVLAFAFDEMGTSKSSDECWVTRHALCRILNIVAKYGGVLTLRSNNAEVIYVGDGEGFLRKSDQGGYSPTTSRRLKTSITGTHIQLILPIDPIGRKPDKRDSVLLSSLPTKFSVDESHVKGHLIPLYERLMVDHSILDLKGVSLFKKASINLAQEILVKRPRGEPLILDFGQLVWTPSQFETFLHNFQNVLQNRPVLLVELNPNLANEVVSMEDAGDITCLTHDEEDEEFVSEQFYLETYSGIHSTLLAIDSNGDKYIFGLPSRKYEKPLLGLLDRHKTFDEILDSGDLDRPTLKSILNNINPLFSIGESGEWGSVWSDASIAVEAKRVMTEHFDVIAARCKAWRGGEGSPEERYNLPWRNVWVSEFFESSRILTRQRYSDEAAQRLIYRLKYGLKKHNKTFKDVGLLACVTSPANLLAAALHRWWPSDSPPAIADLGPYVFLNPNGVLPRINFDGGIVVVQDVLEDLKVSSKLMSLLSKQNAEVLCVISMVRLVRSEKEKEEGEVARKLGVTDVDGWELIDTDSSQSSRTYVHSMVNLRRPLEVEQPVIDTVQDVYWVEPRTLRPFRYDFIRRQEKKQKGGKQQSSERTRPKFYKAEQPGVLCAGHYVYGDRHYTISVDVKRAIDGLIGDKLLPWLRDLCVGKKRAHQQDWESSRGHKLEGDVSAVLMPLHSQMHYIWPKLELMLAKYGRRLPMWLLDATIFLGHGAAYRLPMQFDRQIHAVTGQILAAKKNNKNDEVGLGLRILILDDAVISGRTAETILAEVDRVVYKARDAFRKEYGVLVDEIDPIEWIRYFSIFDQMEHAKHQHWRNVRRSGFGRGVKCVFESYQWIAGVPVYDERNCPHCACLRRLNRLSEAAKRVGNKDVQTWAKDRIGSGESILSKLSPVQPLAMDAPGFHPVSEKPLPDSINLLSSSSKKDFTLEDADEAILRFYELMYHSHPPSEVLIELNPPNAWPPPGRDGRSFERDYSRFRWAVFEWCILKWPRVIADCAQEEFIESLKTEVKKASPLVESIYESISVLRDDINIKKFIVWTIEQINDLESRLINPKSGSVAIELGELLLPLDMGLNLFILSIPEDEIKEYTVVDGKTPSLLLDILRSKSTVPLDQLSLLRNMRMQLNRDRKVVDPSWSLSVLSETLFRGRSSNSSTSDSHQLLPRVLLAYTENPKQGNLRQLLKSSLTLFVTALKDFKDLSPFVAKTGLRNMEDLLELAVSILAQLSSRDSVSESDLTLMTDMMFTDSSFCKDFHESFHARPSKVIDELKGRLENAANGEFLKFTYTVDDEVKDHCALIPLFRLSGFISNWAIDAIDKINANGQKRSHVEFSLLKADYATDRIRIRIFTNFRSLKETNRHVMSGRNRDIELNTLKKFGAKVADKWVKPDSRLDGDFTSLYELSLPIGFFTTENET